MALNINISKEESNLNDFLLIYDLLGERPNRIIIHDTFSGFEFESIIKSENYSNVNSVTEFIPNDDEYLVNEKNLAKISEESYGEIWISYVILNKNSEKYLINDIVFYFKDDNQREKINFIIEKLSDCIFDYDNKSFEKINTLVVNNSILDIEPLYFDSEYDIDTCYNDKTIKDIKNLSKKIKKSNTGLSIFYGERGTGKTSISKYLASKIDRMSIYIPINMIEQSINNPEFRGFIKKFDKCFLIVDDCEYVYNSLFGKMNLFSSNILQLIDGFLSDNLNLHILLIFNIDNIDDIDENLLESNNLVDIVEFDHLCHLKAEELSKNLGHNKKYKNSILLNDVIKGKSKSNKLEIGLK
jgi:hypothetical protein